MNLLRENCRTVRPPFLSKRGKLTSHAQQVGCHNTPGTPLCFPELCLWKQVGFSDVSGISVELPAVAAAAASGRLSPKLRHLPWHRRPNHDQPTNMLGGPSSTATSSSGPSHGPLCPGFDLKRQSFPALQSSNFKRFESQMRSKTIWLFRVQPIKSIAGHKSN